jgi:hypothetical protein
MNERHSYPPQHDDAVTNMSEDASRMFALTPVGINWSENIGMTKAETSREAIRIMSKLGVPQALVMGLPLRTQRRILS